MLNPSALKDRAAAQVGLSGIPKRFLEGLEKAGEFQFLAETLASQVGNT